jgi:hypothetical protein
MQCIWKANHEFFLKCRIHSYQFRCTVLPLCIMDNNFYLQFVFCKTVSKLMLNTFVNWWILWLKLLQFWSCLTLLESIFFSQIFLYILCFSSPHLNYLNRHSCSLRNWWCNRLGRLGQVCLLLNMSSFAAMHKKIDRIRCKNLISNTYSLHSKF